MSDLGQDRTRGHASASWPPVKGSPGHTGRPDCWATTRTFPATPGSLTTALV